MYGKTFLWSDTKLGGHVPPCFVMFMYWYYIYFLVDANELTDSNGASPEEQRVNNNKAVATSSDEDISEDDVEEDKNFKPSAALSGTLPYCFVL